MTKSSEESEASIDLWVALVRAQRRALAQIDAVLKAEGLPPLAWYDALLELGRAKDGLRVGALEAAMLLEQYNVSRLIDRLVAAGLVDRQVDPEDARARRLSLTTDGKAMLEKMWPVYRQTLRDAFGACLTEGEARQAAALLRRLAPPS